jgi:CHASE3 domain sensor protein
LWIVTPAQLPEDIVSNTTKAGIAPTPPASAVTERRVSLGFAFALVCTALLGAVSYLSFVRLLHQAEEQARRSEVAGSLELLLGATTDSEAAERGYVITGDERFLERYRQAAAVIESQTIRLRWFAEENLIERPRLDAAAALVADLLKNLHSVMELRKNQGFAAAQRETLGGNDELIHDRIRGAIAQMQNTGAVELAERVRQTRASAVLARAVIVGGGILACGFGGWALIAIRRDFAGRAQAERALPDAGENLELPLRERERTSSERVALPQMASGIAHDINNAISPVTLYIDSLLEDEPGLSARGRVQLEIIQRAVDDVARTVARMREFLTQQ